MSKEERELLENILTAEALILARFIDQEKKAKGVNRVGGDYLNEAMDEIMSSRGRVLERINR